MRPANGRRLVNRRIIGLQRGKHEGGDKRFEALAGKGVDASHTGYTLFAPAIMHARCPLAGGSNGRRGAATEQLIPEYPALHANTAGSRSRSYGDVFTAPRTANLCESSN